MLIISNVSKKYKKNEVFNNLNYRFDDTGLYLVTGKSGKGKTTLLNILGGVDFKYSGKIYSDNYVLYFKDKDCLVSNLTVKENFYLFEIAENVAIQDYFNLTSILKKKVKKLSLGEKQLVLLTLALNSSAKTIILDEPFSALSENNLKKASELIEMMSEKKLVIIASHISLFHNYKELNMEKYSKRKIKECEQLYVKNNKKYKLIYYLFYLKKVLLKKIIFYLSLFFIIASFYNIKNYSTSIKEDYINSINIETGNVISKRNVLKDLNDDVFYEVIKKLHMYVSNYNANYYSERLYEKNLVVGEYYVDNAIVLSTIDYVEENLKSNEIILGINYENFCLKNSIYVCDENYLRTLLVNKKINEFNLHINNIFESENTTILSNKRFNKVLTNNSYVEYYFDINKAYINETFKMINSDDFLSEFTYVKIGESEETYRYNVKLVSKSFVGPINYEKYIVCLDKGYDCYNYLNHFENLVKVDDSEIVIGFKTTSNELKLDEVVISSALKDKLNKSIDDQISMYFEYDGVIKQLNFIIKGIENDNDYYIYHNSSFSYLLFSKLLNYKEEDLTIKNIIIFEDLQIGDKYEMNLYKEVLQEVSNMFDKMNRIINVINISVTIISVIILVFLEFFYNKFKKEYNRYLKFI